MGSRKWRWEKGRQELSEPQTGKQPWAPWTDSFAQPICGSPRMIRAERIWHSRLCTDLTAAMAAAPPFAFLQLELAAPFMAGAGTGAFLHPIHPLEILQRDCS